MFRTIVAGCNGRERGNGAGVARAMNERFTRALPPLVALVIVAGAVTHLAGATVAGDAVWAVALVAVLVPLTVGVGRSLRAGDVGVDVIALLAMAGGAGARAVPGRRGRRADAQRRQRARGGGRPAGAPRADGAPRAGAAHRAPAQRRPASRRSGRGARRPATWCSCARGEVVPVDGRRRRRAGRARRVRADRRVAARPARGRRAGAQRHRERGRGVRRCAPTRPAAESAYCGDRATRARRARPSARRSCGWPTATPPFLLPVTARARGPRLGAERRSRPGAGGARRRHALPADPRRADRARGRRVARGARRRRGQGRRARSSSSAARAPCCSTRPARSRSARPRSSGSSRSTASTPTSCCASRPRSTSSRRTWLAEALVHDAEGRGLALSACPWTCTSSPATASRARVDGRHVTVGSGCLAARARDRVAPSEPRGRPRGRARRHRRRRRGHGRHGGSAACPTPPRAVAAIAGCRCAARRDGHRRRPRDRRSRGAERGRRPVFAEPGAGRQARGRARSEPTRRRGPS